MMCTIVWASAVDFCLRLRNRLCKWIFRGCNSSQKMPFAARKAGRARLKGPRRRCKHWWHKRFSFSHDKHVRHSLGPMFDMCKRTRTFVFQAMRRFLQMTGGLHFLPHHVVSCRCCKRAKAQATAGPSDVSPFYGLNQILRGGGGGGAARASARKRAENQEEALLQALADVVKNFSQQQRPQPRPKAKSQAAPKSKPKNQEDQDQKSSEKGLLEALERIIERAQKQPGTLLQRLTTLIHTASQGHAMRKKTKQKKKAENQQNADERPSKKPKHAHATDVQSNSAAPHVKPEQRKKNTGAFAASWSEVAQGKPPPDKGKHSNRTLGPGRPQPEKHKETWSLLNSAWPKAALVQAATVREALEKGIVPTGQACLCQTWNHIEDFQRLAKLHKLEDKAFALLLAQGEGEKSDGKRVNYFPTWENARTFIRPFFVQPLVKAIPDMPVQKVHATNVPADASPLATFRVTVPKALLAKVSWEAIKNNPRKLVFKVFGEHTVQTTYGWKEVQIGGKRQTEPEILLQGFLRCKESSANAVLQLSGTDGLFVDKLCNSPSPRPNVWWFALAEDEDLHSYFVRAAAEAKKENASLCFRKGGNACLGMRLQSAKKMGLQLHAWTLHGVPKHWFGQDVMQCLFDAGCTEAAIIRLPEGRQRSWLVKAKVNDENNLGVVGIQAGARVLYLSRVQHKNKRSAEVLSVIKPSVSRHAVIAKPEAEKKAGDDDARARERSRSPNKGSGPSKTSVPSKGSVGHTENVPAEGPAFPFADKIFSLDCGGGGNCGYQALAAGLALERGQSFDSFKQELQARGRTVRHDIFKHMEKHVKEYKEWFAPSERSEHMDAGSTPLTWEAFLESTLREGRWIEGLSLRAASRCYGVQIIVVPLQGEEKDRPMAFGEVRSGKDPIVLLLNTTEGHYTLAQLKAGRQWPREWMSAPAASVGSAAFRGGGKSVSSADWRPAATPSRKSSHSWRPACTPEQSVVSRVRSCLPSKSKPRSKVASIRSPSSCHPFQAPSCKAKSVPGSSSGARARVPGNVGSQNAHHIKPQAIADQYRWTCNLCQEVFRTRMPRSLSCARRGHIQKVHPGKAKHVTPVFRKRMQIATPSADIPVDQRSWSCPKCNKGFAWMSQRSLNASRLAHEKVCYGLTTQQLRKRCYVRDSWKTKHVALNKNNALLRRNETATAIQDFNAKGPGFAFRVPKSLFDPKTGSDSFSCATCTLFHQKWKGVSEHQCNGREGRNMFMKHQLRKAFWHRHRKSHPKLIEFLIKQWKVTKSELQTLEEGLATAGGRRGICPAQKCCWYKDVVEDGDVHPHPGPSSNSSTHMEVLTINAGGAANAWAVARWTCAHRPAVVVIQELRMNQAKQSDFANFLLRHGYRSWFACPPTHGGVAILVRFDKPAQLIRTHTRPEGQAIMLQLDHALIVGVYFSPNSAACDIATTLDDWVSSVHENKPLFILGDFNEEPSFAQRWSTIRGFGSACTVNDSMGQPLPTRWSGHRCIDWIWASHILMVEKLHFCDEVFSDHKSVCFSLQYSQKGCPN